MKLVKFTVQPVPSLTYYPKKEVRFGQDPDGYIRAFHLAK